MKSGSGRPGVASLALLLILVITAAWWALAFWPAGAVEPTWLLRTRAVCFGSAPGGLPDAGGWVVLIGEPLGMLGVLFAVWGRAVRDDLTRMHADRRWRTVLYAVVIATVVGGVKAVQRVAFATGLGETVPAVSGGAPTRTDIDASAFVLTDQRGQRTSIADIRGRPLLLTFAFGHCATVCPVVVHDVRSARTAAHRADVPLVIITLDPWRDTPARLPAIATEWELGPDDRVLSGSVADVERALDALKVVRRRDARTGDVEHVSTVMASDDRGHLVWRVDGGWARVTELLATLPPARGMRRAVVR